ncbi:MAG: hypothetical protein AB1472_00730 [Candidatus Omnitrophota bacterium]
MAEAEKTTQGKSKRKNCANCSKQIKRIVWLYRNGKFFCSKGCFKVFDKKQKEEAKQKAEQEKQKQQEAAPKEEKAPAPTNPVSENQNKTEPKSS